MTNEVNKKKKNYRIVDVSAAADHRMKIKQSIKRDKYLDFAWELKKAEEHEIDDDTNCNWYT